MKNSNKATLGGGEKKMATPKTGVEPATTKPTGEVTTEPTGEVTTKPTGEVKEELLEHPIVLGRGSDGKMVEATLGELKSTLISGLPGSGKSSLLRHIIDQSCDQAQVLCVDLKRVSYLDFRGRENFNLITDINRCAELFQDISVLLERRFQKMEQLGTDKCDAKRILIVVDEFAELSGSMDQNTAEQIRRILSLGRACNITMVVATQQASRRILTGALLDLFCSKIGLRQNSVYASKIAIGRAGCEHLPDFTGLYLNHYGYMTQFGLMPPLGEEVEEDDPDDFLKWE